MRSAIFHNACCTLRAFSSCSFSAICWSVSGRPNQVLYQVRKGTSTKTIEATARCVVLRRSKMNMDSAGALRGEHLFERNFDAGILGSQHVTRGTGRIRLRIADGRLVDWVDYP